MQTQAAILERSVGNTLCAFSRGEVAREEAELDLVELIATRISGKTDYAMACIGFYVRATLRGMADKRVQMADVFDVFVDAAVAGAGGHQPATATLADGMGRWRN